MPLGIEARVDLLEQQVAALVTAPSQAFTFDLILNTAASVPSSSPLRVELASVTFDVGVGSHLRIPHLSVDFTDSPNTATVKTYHDDITPIVDTRHQIDAVSNGTGNSQVVIRQNNLRTLSVGRHRIYVELEGEPETRITAGRLHVEVTPIGEAV